MEIHLEHFLICFSLQFPFQLSQLHRPLSWILHAFGPLWSPIASTVDYWSSPPQSSTVTCCSDRHGHKRINFYYYFFPLFPYLFKNFFSSSDNFFLFSFPRNFFLSEIPFFSWFIFQSKRGLNVVIWILKRFLFTNLEFEVPAWAIL